MNRSQHAATCVQALAKQTLPPNLVVVADNDSKDDTIAALHNLSDLPFSLVVHRMPQNLGNAGGIEEAMKIAFEMDIDAVWILDDDSWPRDNALEKLVIHGWRAEVVRHSLQLDPQTGLFTWPLPIYDDSGNWKLSWKSEDLPDQELCHSRAAWTGALISREIYQAVGRVLGELFIRGEDEEYPWRIGKSGFTFELVKTSILDHPGPQNLRHWKFRNWHFMLERGISDWKLYYKVRNMIWLKRQQTGFMKALLMTFAYLLTVSLMEKGRNRLHVLFHAARDGWNGKLGKWEHHV